MVATTTNALLAFIWPCDRDFDVSQRQSLWLSPHSQRLVRIWWMLDLAAATAARCCCRCRYRCGCCFPRAAGAWTTKPQLLQREVIGLLYTQEFHSP